MSTIEEIRIAEKRVKEVLDELKTNDAQDPNSLGAELVSATDEYARTDRELSSR
jgi:hypothetical protein